MGQQHPGHLGARHRRLRLVDRRRDGEPGGVGAAAAAGRGVARGGEPSGGKHRAAGGSPQLGCIRSSTWGGRGSSTGNLPYPNTFLLWPQMRSPLFWDAIDIVSFLGVAFLFWFTGLIPDLASMRDRSIERMARDADKPGALTRRLRAQLYGIPALGWRGSVIHWRRWEAILPRHRRVRADRGAVAADRGGGDVRRQRGARLARPHAAGGLHRRRAALRRRG